MRMGDDSALDRIAAGLINPKTGAVAGAHTGAAAPGAGADDLFGEMDDGAELFDDQPIAPPKRRPGRPPGSVNRTTATMQRWLMAKGYRDPAEFLAALVSADPVTLAAELSGREREDVEPVEALEMVKLQVKAADALMPYFYSRKPLEVVQKGDGVQPIFVIRTEFQGVSGSPAASSQIEASHEAPQVIDLSGEKANA